MNIEAPRSFVDRRNESKELLQQALEKVESIKNEELTINEVQEKLRFIISDLNTDIEQGRINVGNKKQQLIAVGNAFKKAADVSEDSTIIFIKKLKENI